MTTFVVLRDGHRPEISVEEGHDDLRALIRVDDEFFQHKKGNIYVRRMMGRVQGAHRLIAGEVVRVPLGVFPEVFLECLVTDNIEGEYTVYTNVDTGKSYIRPTWMFEERERFQRLGS